MSTTPLRRGDWVEVLAPSEILATLDDAGAIDRLPFMPEMARYCGRRFRVDTRTERVCDTVGYSGSRRIADAVMLEDLRCDGASHGGCQAECRYIWKEAWLRRIDPQSRPRRNVAADELDALIRRVSATVQQTVGEGAGGQRRWSCQTTELLNASAGLNTLDMKTYLREVTTGNVAVPKFLRVMCKATVWEPMRKLRLLTAEGLLRGTGAPAEAQPALGLQPGEWVRVKSAAQIAATLSPTGHHRGLSFDREMLPFCGKVCRVKKRVTRIIDDRDGRMINIKTDCIVLENVVCSGECSARRVFCSRAIVSFWRECWLERVEAAAVPAQAEQPVARSA
jgi:hypothetical protein